MHTYIHTYMHTYMHTYIDRYIACRQERAIVATNAPSHLLTT